MAKKSSLDRLDLRPLVRGSRLRYGALETRGVASILLGVAAVVVAAGASAALAKSAVLLPETLREARLFWTALRPPRPELAGEFTNATAR